VPATPPLGSAIQTQNLESLPESPVPESPARVPDTPVTIGEGSPKTLTAVPPPLTNSPRLSRSLPKKRKASNQPWRCEVKGCGMELCSKFSLRRHLENHAGNKPFCCIWCGRGFAQLSTLKRHYQTHTGLKPFPCQICGRSFGDKVNLNNHMDIEHRN